MTGDSLDSAASVAGERLALLRDLAETAREEVRDYWVRYAEDREALVLVGPRLWQNLAATVARQGEPLWHLDRVASQVVGQLVGLDRMTRIVRAEIGLDEWRVVLLTDRRGSVPSS
ncbi:hypothetical protein [Micromonospora sp. RV43]|uniref:hypothetical protein n=1 Tax=Micromonospora sp. RV43 TaxID=1661387 RepID=UPI00064BE0BB|nr:hypothetical protein [Micromonospora sp. RV43]